MGQIWIAFFLDFLLYSRYNILLLIKCESQSRGGIRLFVKKMQDLPKEKMEAGEKTYKQVLISAEEAPHFAMRRFIIEVGGFMPKHTNTVEHEQLVLRGAAEIGLGDKIYQVQKDDVVFIPKGVPHWYQNIGDEPFEFLCLVPNEEDRIKIMAG